MTKTQKGFTLIELLVVIAIIGILAGILFVAINPKKQTDKAKVSNIKSQLAQVPTQATLVDTGSFATVCTNAKTKGLIDAAAAVDTTATLVNCYDTDNGFAAEVDYNSVKYCVDASGVHENKIAKDEDTSTNPVTPPQCN